MQPGRTESVECKSASELTSGRWERQPGRAERAVPGVSKDAQEAEEDIEVAYADAWTARKPKLEGPWSQIRYRYMRETA